MSKQGSTQSNNTIHKRPTTFSSNVQRKSNVRHISTQSSNLILQIYK